MGVERSANDRVNTVAGHDNVTFNAPDRHIPHGVDELAPHPAISVPSEADEMVAGTDTLRAKASQHSPVEDSDEITPVYRELRPLVARGESPGFAPDPLAVFGIVGELRCRNADGGESIEKTKLGQLPHGMREDVYSDEIGRASCRERVWLLV